MKLLIFACLVAVTSTGYIGGPVQQQPQQQGAVLGPDGVPYETAANLAARAAHEAAFAEANARAARNGPNRYDGAGYSGNGYSGAQYSGSGSGYVNSVAAPAPQAPIQQAPVYHAPAPSNYNSNAPAPYRGPIHIPKIGPLGVPEEPEANLAARAYHAAAYAKITGSESSSGYSSPSQAAPVAYNAPASYSAPSSYSAPAPVPEQNYSPQGYSSQGYSGQGYTGQGFGAQSVQAGAPNNDGIYTPEVNAARSFHLAAHSAAAAYASAHSKPGPQGYAQY